MAEISWIKLKTTMFDDEKIRLIQAVPESDAILVIWIRLLVLAGKTNDDGLIYIQRNMPYSEEMLATLFGKNVNTVRLALTTLANFNMIDLTANGLISVTNWEKHQNVEGLEKIKEQNRLRAKRHYEKKKNSNVSLTLSNATDKEKELDKDIDKEIDNKDKEKIPYSEIISYLNQKAERNFKNAESHKKFIRARWKEGQRLDDFKRVIDNKVTDANNPTDFFDAKYLQPSTLFGTKFDQYLNQQPVNTVKEDDKYAELDF
ncbi:phage replisome organizer N-terminal domain-containing protein [Carnobacterium divergens]|uniref:phage replisome organizer N-terminal domain-containing protein n=1 Tax=Carnobacterium divergens TaxID=2748 RepID=UPI0028906BEC|nr:phage replisome organizer N-terminal domain-containing protein [Carnobacterium divergens]MDT1997250.1 phage replisome organizer N-terminal domain-containing protein [Carnobacterium divergens]